MSDKNTANIIKIHGIEINIDSVKSGKKDGTPMNKTEFKKSFPKKRIPDGKDDDGQPKFKLVEHPKFDEIWEAVEAEMKKK